MISPSRPLLRPARNERGMTLLLSLLILMVLSILTVAAIQTSGLQERIAGNTRDRSLAFNAAESALRDAEAYLTSTTNLPPFGSNGHYFANKLPSPYNDHDVSSAAFLDSKEVVDALNSIGIAYGDKTGATPLPSSVVKAQPRYLLEMMPVDTGRPITYRITALGTGRDSSLVVLQSYYTPPQDTVIN